MAQSGQIIPEHSYPHTEVYINDYSQLIDEGSSVVGGTKLICVFLSPKGPDRKMHTINYGSKEFLQTYGIGPYSVYGQPLLNAWAAISSEAATLHCMRVTADNATYANTHIILKYKLVGETVPDLRGPRMYGFNDEGEQKDMWNLNANGITGKTFLANTDPKAIIEPETKTRNRIIIGGTPEPPDPLENSYLELKYIARSAPQLRDLKDLESIGQSLVHEGVDEEGYSEMLLMSVAYIGRGIYGNEISFRVSNYSRGDRNNVYKNYTVEIMEGTSQLENYQVTFYDDAIVNQESLFIDTVFDDPETGSSRVKIVSQPDNFRMLFDLYKSVCPDTKLSYQTFDPILGIDKLNGNGAIPRLNIKVDYDAGDFMLNNVAGIGLSTGSDGDFDTRVAPTIRSAAIERAYLKAFNGEFDTKIRSRSSFPCDLILDANYPMEVKYSIGALNAFRKDSMAMFDCGIGFTEKSYPLEIAEDFDAGLNLRTQTVDAFWGKIKDPYCFKAIPVTCTYAFALKLPSHYQRYGGKHIPFAGGEYGYIEDVFIKNSIEPVYDEDIDAAIMDKLVENRINYARVNPRTEIIRGTQTTRQEINTNLSEQSNMQIVLDIKRDCEWLVANYEYQFNEAADLARYNREIEQLLTKYKDAQVRRISAVFQSNNWERNRGILHLYVEMVHKDLVKINLVEIDVCRDQNIV